MTNHTTAKVAESYIFDLGLDVGRGFGVDLVDVSNARKACQDNSAIFFNALYGRARVVERYSASHTISAHSKVILDKKEA